MARPTALAAVALALLAAGPSTAVAAVRTATTNGSGDCLASPCTIATAINMAGANDEVVVMPGAYDVGATSLSSTAPGLNVHGAAGQARPTITTSAALGLKLTGAGTQVSHLEVSQGGAQLSSSAAFFFTGSVASDLIVRASSQDGNACEVFGSATLRDSVCEAPGKDAEAIHESKDDGTPNTAAFRNVTAFATGQGGQALQVIGDATSGGSADVHVTNSILRSVQGGADVNAVSQLGSPAKITLDHTNFGFQSSSSTGGPNGQIVADNTNQRFMPVAFASVGDYHQAPTAVTIDKGIDDPLNGLTDFDGDVRAFRTTDIGADEFVPPPTAVTGGADGVTRNAATVHGTVNPNSSPTTYHFEFGLTTNYGGSTQNKSAGAGTADAPVGSALSKLGGGATYHYRIVATSSHGTTRGADRTFGTSGAAKPNCVVPKLRKLTLKKAKRKLKKAHCRLGKVKRPKLKKHHGRRPKLVVKKQSPKAGRTLPNGAKVRVTLGRAAKKKR